MITQWTRVIVSDNGVLNDVSLAAQNDDTIAIPLVAGEDSIYIGQHYPFNNIFFDVSVSNTNASSWEVDIWDGETLHPAVDILDETKVGGVTLARSGVVQYSPDEDEGWDYTQDTSETNEGPDELSSLKIYNLYWMRIKPSADLSAGTILNRIGYRFANDQLLRSLDPDIDQYLASWETGKTDWTEQLVVASDQLIYDLKGNGLVAHPGQLLRINEIAYATAYRALINIYTVLGPDFEFKLTNARNSYREALRNRFTLDNGRDGIESPGEVSNSPSSLGVR